MRPATEPVEPIALVVGQRVRFERESRRPYVVRAVSEHFVVCTRQADFKPKGELFYTVIDWRNGCRGPVGIVGGGWDVTTDDKCSELCEELEAGKWELSRRRWVRLDIQEILP